MSIYSKRAQGMPLNVIIIAVICLLVLVVIIWIFSTKTGTAVKGIESCDSKQGECVATADLCKGPVIGYAPKEVSCDNDKANPPNSGTSDGAVCCLKIT